MSVGSLSVMIKQNTCPDSGMQGFKCWRGELEQDRAASVTGKCQEAYVENVLNSA